MKSHGDKIRVLAIVPREVTSLHSVELRIWVSGDCGASSLDSNGTLGLYTTELAA